MHNRGYLQDEMAQIVRQENRYQLFRGNFLRVWHTV